MYTVKQFRTLLRLSRPTSRPVRCLRSANCVICWGLRARWLCRCWSITICINIQSGMATIVVRGPNAARCQNKLYSICILTVYKQVFIISVNTSAAFEKDKCTEGVCLGFRANGGLDQAAQTPQALHRGYKRPGGRSRLVPDSSLGYCLIGRGEHLCAV